MKLPYVDKIDKKQNGLGRRIAYHIDGDVRPESDVERGLELGEDVEDLGEAGQVRQEVAGAGDVAEVAAVGGPRSQH